MELEVDFLAGVADLKTAVLIDVLALFSSEVVGPFHY